MLLQNNGWKLISDNKLQHPPIQQNNTHIPFTQYSRHKLQSVTLQYILTQTYSRILFWKHTKITSWCNIYKYPITNHVTSILHQKHSCIKFRVLLFCSIFFAH